MSDPQTMTHGTDSAQILSAAGTAAGFFFANYDRLLASACALVGLLYTLWKWRKEVRRGRRPRD